MLGGVPLTGNDHGLQRLPLLVLDGEWSTVRPLKFNLYFTEGSILLAISGLVANDVLIANIGGDVAEDLRKLALETRMIPTAACHLGERVHLVVRLQEV